MKTQATFNELGIIFTTIAKAEEKVKTLKEAEDRYDVEAYADDIDAMIKAHADRDKARKAVKVIFQKVIDVLELNPSFSTDEFMIRESTRLYEAGAFLSDAKYAAIQIARNIND